jgi:hypothetical protein
MAKTHKASIEYTLNGKRKRKKFTCSYPDIGIYKVRDFGALITDRHGKRSKVVKIPKNAEPPYKIFKPGNKRASNVCHY